MTVGKIFSVQENAFAGDKLGSPSVKIEPEECHYVHHSGQSSHRGRGGFKRKSRGQGSFHPYRKTNSHSGCYACGEKNHIARMCPFKKNEPNSSRNPTLQMQHLAHDGAEKISRMEAEDNTHVGSTYLTFMVSEH